MHETTPALTNDRDTEPPAINKVSVWTTVATVALIPVAVFLGGWAGMATLVRPQTVAVIMNCWWASWTVTPVLVVASRLSPRHPALAGACRWAGWVAPFPPSATILLTLGL
ncbi:hypothetical protein [Streptomyces sp. TRM49041]|uniref:hypothetical protein n=1 Tax=Streptomyces sp. TRM49041 TaxID=2603216 RepID=UPI0011EEC24C|nr:hypothetical protein [Streptomyces sp. TRM49041]